MPDLTDDELALLARAATRVTLRRRTVLYRQGDRDSAIYYLLSGRVRISRAAVPEEAANGRSAGARATAPLATHAGSPRGALRVATVEPASLALGSQQPRPLRRRGRELTLHYVRKGQLFGELALVDDAPRETRAEVVDDAVVLVVRADAFERLATIRPGLALHVIRVLGRRQRELEAKMEALLFKGVPTRLAELLLRLAAEYGVDDSRGTLLATRFTHRELACLIGASRETVSQTLLDFARRNLVATDGRRLILRREALRRVA